MIVGVITAVAFHVGFPPDEAIAVELGTAPDEGVIDVVDGTATASVIDGAASSSVIVRIGELSRLHPT